MEERAEKAVALMQQKGYNCAQAVACVFAEEAGAVYCKDLKGVGTGKPLLSCPDCVRLACRLAAREVFPEKA